jgi:hypothetical protein
MEPADRWRDDHPAEQLGVVLRLAAMEPIGEERAYTISRGRPHESTTTSQWSPAPSNGTTHPVEQLAIRLRLAAMEPAAGRRDDQCSLRSAGRGPSLCNGARRRAMGGRGPGAVSEQ